MPFDAALLDRLATSFRSTAAHGREQVTVGPFRAWFHPSSNDPLMSVAVPVEPDADWRSALGALGDCFALRRRSPRLEFFAELHPGLAGALEAEGIALDMRAPVMALSARGFRPALRARPGDYATLRADEPRLAESFLAMQGAAFGMDPRRLAAWQPQLLAGLADGTVRAGADLDEGTVVSGATLQCAGGAGELAGVGTRPDRQGRGWAGDVCSRLLRTFFDEGHDLCWLSAGVGAQGLYTRLGFEVVGTQLNYGASHPA